MAERHMANINYIRVGRGLSGRVLNMRRRGCGFEPHRRHCVVVLEQDTFILAYLVLVQPRNICPCLTERLLMGRKECNQTNKTLGYVLKEKPPPFLHG